ncbi:MAG: oxygen-independent coproporphyrinogen III oxidase [Geminicoccaceae bacterium]|nr:MAG: oxygen-independent coproporphyrinogen III oxidase [Geminicoccaceae bacterium]
MRTSSRLALQYGDQKVPRYTSYPTAPHFHALSAPTYRQWLGELSPDLRLSLYLHVPFCKELCWYCGCATTVTQNQGRMDAFIGLLLREIEITTAAMRAVPPVCHLHFGGGTPSAVGAEGLERILDAVKAAFPFEADAELAIEIDPRTADQTIVDTLAKGGINRASLGVQSLDPVVQEAINRIQPYEVTRDIALMLRRAGIPGLNLDLLYGLPYQTEASCQDDAKRVLDLQPDRLSVFGYAHVPQMRKHQQLLPEDRLPDGPERADHFDAIAEVMLDAGYVRIGLDHFAHPDDAMAKALRAGTLRRNFQGYTTDPADALIGLGTTAIGSLPQGYAQNHAHMGDYRKAVLAGELPVSRGRPVTKDDLARRTIINKLMCDGQLDLEAVAEAFAMRTADLLPDPERLRPLLADGLVQQDGHRYTVAPDHWSFLRLAAACFDAYLDASADRHSRAV